MDKTQDLKNVMNDGLDAKGWSNFSFSRPMDTGDATQDLKIECGKAYAFKWVGNDSSSKMSKHNKAGKWNIEFNDDCSIKSGAPTMVATSLLAAAVGILTYVY